MKTNKYGNYKRLLTKEQIQDRFDSHKKLHDFEVKKLFGELKGKDVEERMRWLEKGYRNFLIFDIEAQLFDVRMGYMICWYAIEWDLVTDKYQMVYDYLREDDMKEGYNTQSMNFDKRLLSTLAKEFDWADVISGHYISKFDIPYFCSRCHLTGQDDLVPKYNSARIQDTWAITKRKYNLWNSGGNSLRNTGTVILGKDDKTSVDLKIWKTIYYKSHPKWKQCLKYICDHCEIDVEQNFNVVVKEMKRVAVGGGSI